MDRQLATTLTAAVNPERLARTALALIAIPSPTRSAGAVADELARLLAADGFAVERPVADWPEAPAVVTRLHSGQPGRTLQFDGHLDTVHLPFVPPKLEGGVLYGSGASDMKGGVAAFVEALRVLRDTGALSAGQVLLTTHDHHEGPWGDRRQLKALIRDGYVGDGVLLPEYLATPLPVAGRGQAIFAVRLTRPGEPVHEVLQAPGTPQVLLAGAELALRLRALDIELKVHQHPYAGADSCFVGHLASGEIYNQVPVECMLKGTRRWIEAGTVEAVRAEFAAVVAEVAAQHGVPWQLDFSVSGDAFVVAAEDPLVRAFQAAHQAVSGAGLPLGGKPFMDDGNTFAALAGIPALTHGPAATGAHTLDERVSLEELVRVARVYALCALAYCNP
ncbi:MAG: M20/M25/M40 family metallo-hydrolase [Candidatus Latescibacteria bacterium]|nr:M20/M25/M40 family metallo-hydrolase [Candidatus Latescibacterota bacterium]